MNVATLGPKGTFSHEAVKKYDPEAKIIFKDTIYDVFDSVKSKESELGIVPLENSISGTVGITVDCLQKFNLKIQKEIIVPVKHNLASYVPLNKIKNIYTTLQAYEQCEIYLRKNLPKSEITFTNSNSLSAQKLSQKKGDAAAIVPSTAEDLNGVKIIEEGIQDSKNNVTRFILIGDGFTQPTGNDRTSISIIPNVDKPGLLYSLLGEFSNRKINLSKIESRPAKGKLGDYVFYIDLIGHKDDEKVKDAFTAIEKNFILKVLGSYPREY
ncbi:prephenate dehydratase [Nanoarchaeota archaeon]